MKRSFFGFAFSTLLALSLASPALAAINVNSYGNVNYDSVDLRVPTGLAMRVERVYNSKTNFSGIFGEKWGCWFEERLEVLDTGAVVVHEWGGGAENVFTPIQFQTRPVEAIIDELVAVAEESGQFGSDADKARYREYLRSNHQQEWTRLRDLGLVKQPHVPVGVSFYSNRFGSESITRVPEGYERSTDDGKKLEAFDLSGRLQRVWDPNHNLVALHYDSRGRLAEMDDNFGNRLTFAYDDSGHVARVSDARGRSASYQYDEQGNLIVFTDLDGHVERYLYADDSTLGTWHMLTAIRYADQTSTSVRYDPLEKVYYPNAVRVDERDGSVSKYSYAYKSVDGKCVETFDVVKEDKQGTVIERKPTTTVDVNDSYCSP